MLACMPRALNYSSVASINQRTTRERPRSARVDIPGLKTMPKCRINKRTHNPRYSGSSPLRKCQSWSMCTLLPSHHSSSDIRVRVGALLGLNTSVSKHVYTHRLREVSALQQTVLRIGRDHPCKGRTTPRQTLLHGKGESGGMRRSGDVR